MSIAAARLSPDGSKVAFAALLTLQPTARRSGLSDLLAPVAHAHGVPWDLWVVDVAALAPKRLTNLGEDAMIPVWSPDAKWLTFSGHYGLYLVGSDGTHLDRLAEEPTSAGLAWLIR
jgi:Tol biopolymer transport system component